MKADHLPALDGLRGFAALVVLVSHSAAFGFLPNLLGHGLGQMGVMLFFGLSGFLMAYLYCGKPLNSLSLRSYFVNRIIRVLPLYYIVAIFVALCFIIFDYSFLKVYSWKHIAGNMLLLKGSSVLWTIPVEFHFYVLFLGLWLASITGHFLKAVLVLGSLQLMALVALYLNGIDYGPILFSWLHVFLFGSLVGAYFEPLRRTLENSKLGAILSALAWLVLLLGAVAPPKLRLDLGFSNLVNFLDPITVGYPMLLLVCTVFLLGPFSLFKQPIFRWFGTISYSLYLLHPFVIDGVVEIVKTGALPARFGFPVVLAVSTLVAGASFYGLERPCQRMLRSYFSKSDNDLALRDISHTIGLPGQRTQANR